MSDLTRQRCPFCEFVATAEGSAVGSSRLLAVHLVTGHPGEFQELVAHFSSDLDEQIGRKLLDLRRAEAASQDTLSVERLARAICEEAESIESDPMDFKDCPDRAEHVAYAKELLRLAHQETER